MDGLERANDQVVLLSYYYPPSVLSFLRELTYVQEELVGRDLTEAAAILLPKIASMDALFESVVH